MTKPTIAVLGSINMDLVIQCEKLPIPGQTITGKSLVQLPGGKGANQAVAAARSGGNVRMIGRVGDDGFGASLRGNLEQESIDCGFVKTVSNCESGLAVIGVEQSGENSIIVIPGANARLTAADVEAASDVIAQSDILLVQLEIPLEAVGAGIAIAKQHGVRTVLDPAPAVSLPNEMLHVDLICPNESEASVLCGSSAAPHGREREIVEELHSRGPKAVALTLGSQGTMLFDGQQLETIPSIQVDAVDTTAAGDAFAGALAVDWVARGSLTGAIRVGNVAGALAASKLGAQPSLPRRDAIDRLLAGT